MVARGSEGEGASVAGCRSEDDRIRCIRMALTRCAAARWRRKGAKVCVRECVCMCDDIAWGACVKQNVGGGMLDDRSIATGKRQRDACVPRPEVCERARTCLQPGTEARRPPAGYEAQGPPARHEARGPPESCVICGARDLGVAEGCGGARSPREPHRPSVERAGRHAGPACRRARAIARPQRERGLVGERMLEGRVGPPRRARCGKGLPAGRVVVVEGEQSVQRRGRRGGARSGRQILVLAVIPPIDAIVAPRE